VARAETEETLVEFVHRLVEEEMNRIGFRRARRRGKDARSCNNEPVRRKQIVMDDNSNLAGQVRINKEKEMNAETSRHGSCPECGRIVATCKHFPISKVVYVKSAPGGGKQISINRGGEVRDYYRDFKRGNKIDQWLKTVCLEQTRIWGVSSYLITSGV